MQKNRTNSKIGSFAWNVQLEARVNEAVAMQNRNSLQAPLSRSAWIVRAIERELAHAARSRKSRKRQKRDVMFGLDTIRDLNDAAVRKEAGAERLRELNRSWTERHNAKVEDPIGLPDRPYLAPQPAATDDQPAIDAGL